MTVSRGPLVSIGCAVYNGEETLERALAGLVGQDYADLEIIIADDCSTDRSLAICEAFAARDARIRILRNDKNVGLTRNFNRLFGEARGTYFMWADQDDIRLPTFVSHTVSVLEADPGVVLCHSLTGAFIGDPTRLVTVCEQGAVLRATTAIGRYWNFLREYSDTTIYGLIRTDVLRETALWRSDVGSGYALLFELLLRGRFAEVPEVLYLYSGRGPRNRPSPGVEYARQNAGRRMPWYYLPFLVVALNLVKGIWRAPNSFMAKPIYTALVAANLLLVNGSKLVYRVAYRVAGTGMPTWLARACKAGLGSSANLRFVNNADHDESLFPKDFDLRPS